MAPAKKLNTYTYQDYKNFDDNMRCEIIEGEVVMMSPAPSVFHQIYSNKINKAFNNYFDSKKCLPLYAPVDVLLDFEYNQEAANIIVQPDLIVLCDKNKLDNRGILGAPDLVVEILSPSTAKYDFGKKMELYLAYGVKEYWVVDTKAQTIHLNFSVDKEFVETIFYADDKDKNVIKSRLFEGLEIPLSEIFEYGFGN